MRTFLFSVVQRGLQASQASFQLSKYLLFISFISIFPLHGLAQSYPFLLTPPGGELCCRMEMEKCLFQCEAVCQKACTLSDSCPQSCIRKLCSKTEKGCFPPKKRTRQRPMLFGPSEDASFQESGESPTNLYHDGRLKGPGDIVFKIENWSDEETPLVVHGIAFGIDNETGQQEILKKSLPSRVRAREVQNFTLIVQDKEFDHWKRHYQQLTVGIEMGNHAMMKHWKYQNLLTPETKLRHQGQLIHGAFSKRQAP